MKNKRGFTLAELLIVLGITGVVAAILLPMVSGLMPDKTKMMYLKVYDELGKNIEHIASDSSLFPVCIDTGSENIGCQEHPLLNTIRPSSKKFNDAKFEGNKKLCNILAFNMNVDNTKCEDSSYAFDSSSFNGDFDSKKSFTTQNGMEWWIVPQVNTKGGGNAKYQTDIYVDIDPSEKSPNCIYNSTSCKNPDRFKFLLAADGTVIPADPMGMMYINTRKSYLKNKKQKVEDDTIAANLTDSLKQFTYKPCVEIYGVTPEQEACENGGGVYDLYSKSCSCKNSGEIWDEASNICFNPEERCADIGKIYDSITGSCKEPEPVLEPEPEVTPVLTVTAYPVSGSIKLNSVSYYHQPDYYKKVAFGAFIHASVSPVQKIDLRIVTRVKSNIYKDYVCTIPAGRDACVTQVINAANLKVNKSSVSTDMPYVTDVNKRNVSNIQVNTQNWDVLTTTSGFWSISTPYSFSISNNDSQGYYNSGLPSAFSYVAKYSGCYKSNLPTWSEAVQIVGEGQEWFINPILPSLITGKNNYTYSTNAYGQDYEILLKSNVISEYKQYYQ